MYIVDRGRAYIIHPSIQHLVATSTRSSIAGPLETQEDLFEACEVGRTGSSPGDGLALRVFEFNELSNALPGCTSRE